MYMVFFSGFSKVCNIMCLVTLGVGVRNVSLMMHVYPHKFHGNIKTTLEVQVCGMSETILQCRFVVIHKPRVRVKRIGVTIGMA